MEEKKYVKISLSSVLLIILIIVIAIMGYYIYCVNNEKINAKNEIVLLNDEVTRLKNENKDLQEKIDTISNTINSNVNEQFNNANEVEKENNNEKSDYLTNFSESVSKELGNGNTITVQYNKKGIFCAEVNSKGEAFIRFETDSDLFKKYGYTYKLANNMANIYIYAIGQDGPEYTFLLRKDGTVSYVILDDSNTFAVKELDEVKDITNIIQIEGNGEEGIGSCGVLFITSDGSCLPFFYL